MRLIPPLPISKGAIMTKLMADEARAALALEASWEIEELAVLLSKELRDRAQEGNLALIGITKRIVRLNGIIMSAISDDAETTDSLAEQFT